MSFELLNKKKSQKKILLTRFSPKTYSTQDGYLRMDRFNPVEYLLAYTLKK